MKSTKGQLKLVEFIQLTHTPQAQLARDLGVKPPSLHEWMNGHSRPNTLHRALLERLCGIPQVDWMTPEELKKLNDW